LPPEKNAAKILKEWPVFTSDGERLKKVVWGCCCGEDGVG